MHLGQSIEMNINANLAHPKIIYLGDGLDADERVITTTLLKKYAQIFIFGYQDMPRIDSNIMMHNIVTNLNAKPIKQKPRRMSSTQYLHIKKKIQKLLDAKFIYPIDYPQWVSNMVPIGKPKGWIRVCIDFRDLNVTYLKDEFPLLNIDTLVDNIEGYEMLSLMDDFFSYNHIWVAPQNQHKIIFTTPRVTFCYKVMPFGVKNVDVTYQ